MTRSRLPLLLLAALLQLLLSCSDARTVPRTQLVVVADTDMAELDEVLFEVTGPGGELQTARGAIVPGAPAFVVLAHESGAALGPYHIAASGLTAGDLVISRTAQVSFVTNRSLTVVVHLLRSCLAAVCADGETCGEQGCRDEAVPQAELLPWSGQPPTLVGPSADDAGVDSDAELTDGGSPVGDTGAGCVTTCDGARERVCEQGMLSAPRACTAPNVCQVASCQEGVGCVSKPGNEGAVCGTNSTCSAGACVPTQTCTAACNPTCVAGAQSCVLDCGTSGETCKPTCAAGSSCSVRCADSDRCDVTCVSGAICDIDCTGDSDCTKIKCQLGAVCLLRCGDNEDCKFNVCDGSQVVDCGKGVLSCRGTCP